MSDENSELTKYYEWREKIEQDKKKEDEPVSLRRIRDRINNVINGNEGT